MSGAAAVITTAGIVVPSGAGVITVAYTTTSACGADTATTTITVTARPVAGAVTGADTLCIGDSLTLSATVSGGTWVSASTTLVSVSATGIVTAIAPGSAAINYVVSNSCGVDTATRSVYVKNPADCLLSAIAVTEKSAHIFVTPNPTSGVLTIRWAAGSLQVTKVSVTTATGVKVFEMENHTADNQVNFDISAFADGVYFYAVHTNKGVETGKVLLLH